MSTPAVRFDAGNVYRRYLSSVTLHGLASAKTCGLGPSDLHLLNILELAGAMTPGEIVTRTGLTTGPTTRLIDRLEAAGYVRRTPAPDDRRKVIVEPVAQPAALDETMAPARRRIGDLMRRYTPEQLAVLFDYFERATEAYQETNDELRATGN
ncbi:MarR family transcriptional regulator [Embleya sp. NPDC005575]|uniref:MarR family winged helix-turn-helix transcriptional regulator n=1 Tax=Embleya sp. NPDC005575 TaxID=3156892 RepID=UPI0033B87119